MADIRRDVRTAIPAIIPRSVHLSTMIAISITRARLSALVAIAGCAASAHAEVYDFKFVRGGGGGGDPANQRIVRGSGSQMCLDVKGSATAQGNRVLFTFWSAISQPYYRIGRITVDVGTHASLFSDMSIVSQSPGVKFQMFTGSAHSFLPNFVPRYTFGLPNPIAYDPSALSSGKFIALSATLGGGKTVADVKAALNQGMNPSTATAGLRVAVIAYHLLGKRPAGVGTLSDDGGFVINSIATGCRRA
jgi:hypothetical protein